MRSAHMLRKKCTVYKLYNNRRNREKGSGSTGSLLLFFHKQTRTTVGQEAVGLLRLIQWDQEKVSGRSP